ncbi:hypothetical protein F0562_015256 [Nyssa sinensis]|uniref:Replication factor A C-terminal domain-containing protein n=1 Tax=Nyssa sinensis TaxID=561372 RepID=A0A5J4ZGI9_9ASTE|nr:hypothetical protein F0562_015256 [Nyssa sinensis]
MLTKTKEGLDCYRCDGKNAESIPRYHIRLEVIDGNDKATVILFDEPATSLVGCTVSDYINLVRKVAAGNWATKCPYMPWQSSEERRCVERLSLVDPLSFAEVCKSWKTFVGEDFSYRGVSGIPWLLMSGQKNEKMRSCLRILEDAAYELKLPKETYIWGSFHRYWLVVVKLLRKRPTNKRFLQISLLNPFRQVIPPGNTLPNISFLLMGATDSRYINWILVRWRG